MLSSDGNRYSPLLHSACKFCTTESVWEFYHREYAIKDTYERIQNQNIGCTTRLNLTFVNA